VLGGLRASALWALVPYRNLAPRLSSAIADCGRHVSSVGRKLPGCAHTKSFITTG